MGCKRVFRVESCIAPVEIRCTNCPRKIGRGMTYVRVVIEAPDEDGVLIEIKRMTLCVWCGVGYTKDRK